MQIKERYIYLPPPTLLDIYFYKVLHNFPNFTHRNYQKGMLGIAANILFRLYMTVTLFDLREYIKTNLIRFCLRYLRVRIAQNTRTRYNNIFAIIFCELHFPWEMYHYISLEITIAGQN